MGKVEQIEELILKLGGQLITEIEKMTETIVAPNPGDKNERPAYAPLIDDFMLIDQECQTLIEKFTSGKIIFECIPAEGAPGLGPLIEKMVAKFVGFQNYLKDLIEKRNAKIQEIANAMRAAVMVNEDTVRGPDGKPTMLKYGPFDVSSKTFRSFDQAVLITKVQELGLFGRLMEHTTINKETGEPEPVVQQEWKILYEPVKNWLREQNLEQVLQEAYEEEEGTPAVTGPKELAWIGATKKKKG